MAKRDLTAHQEKIVKRYYAHHDTIQVNKLEELVSELWLAQAEGDPDLKAKALNRLWKRVRTALDRLDIPASGVEQVCQARDVQALARLVKQAQSGHR